jgi:hypothetical protein
MAKQWMLAGRALVATAAVGGTLVVTGLPAVAAVTRAVAYDGNTRLGFADTSGRRNLAACDTRSDGVGVFGRIELMNGTTVDVEDPTEPPMIAAIPPSART